MWNVHHLYVQMAAEIVTSFPDLPDEITVPPSKPNIRELRLQMAKFLLSSSGIPFFHHVVGFFFVRVS